MFLAILAPCVLWKRGLEAQSFDQHIFGSICVYRIYTIQNIHNIHNTLCKRGLRSSIFWSTYFDCAPLQYLAAARRPSDKWIRWIILTNNLNIWNIWRISQIPHRSLPPSVTRLNLDDIDDDDGDAHFNDDEISINCNLVLSLSKGTCIFNSYCQKTKLTTTMYFLSF